MFHIPRASQCFGEETEGLADAVGVLDTLPWCSSRLCVPPLWLLLKGPAILCLGPSLTMGALSHGQVGGTGELILGMEGLED